MPSVTHWNTAYMRVKHVVKTPDEVRSEFNRIGKPISGWARENGFNPNLVFWVLSGRPCRHGKSHQIAVLLGLKEGEIVR